MIRLVFWLYGASLVGCLFLPILAALIAFSVLGLVGILAADAWLTDRERRAEEVI